MPGNAQFSGGAAYRNRTDDLRITSASLYPTELRRRAVPRDDGLSLPEAWLAPGPAGRGRIVISSGVRLGEDEPHVVAFAVDGDAICTVVA
jgi:hypothetical protein